MNGIIGTAPPGTMYVRALYDYEADDMTSLSFHEGDVIQVITQLESGWWDGVINGVRGWFPSNYCQIVNNLDELSDDGHYGHLDVDDHEDAAEEQDVFDDLSEDGDESDQDDAHGLPLEGTQAPSDKSRADFWIPQATSDGRLFYYNMMTGDRCMELPLESPGSAHETGPQDRMNITVPDRTRPPPEMMARGLTQDEDEDSEFNSASEVEGDSFIVSSRSRSTQVRLLATFALMTITRTGPTDAGCYHSLAKIAPQTTTALCSRLPLRWTLSMLLQPDIFPRTTRS